MSRSDAGADSRFDVVVVGGGAAGLNAALVLGRARRNVLLCDNGLHRNASVREVHGFLSRDGTPPHEIEKIARTELDSYPTVRREASTVRHAEKVSDGFTFSLDNGTTCFSDLVLLATGMVDVLPEIDGLARIWGHSAFVCPYCDGWEVRDRAITISGGARSGIDLAQELYGWTRDIVVCGHPAELSADQAAWISQSGVRIESGAIRKIIDDAGRLVAVELEGGKRIPCDALFLDAPLRQHSDLGKRLGCDVTKEGRIRTDECNRTSVPGCFAAGDCVTSIHQVIVAAASGVVSAIAVNNELVQRDVKALTRSRA